MRITVDGKTFEIPMVADQGEFVEALWMRWYGEPMNERMREWVAPLYGKPITRDDWSWISTWSHVEVVDCANTD